MKKLLSLILILLLIIGLFAGCSSERTIQINDGAELKIVCTIFPQYDWIKQILGTHLNDSDVTLLVDNGVDLHNYQPSASDIINISSCDLFVYVGGESDKWVEDALSESVNPNLIAVNMLDVLGEKAKAEEIIEGMEAEENEDEGETEYDEHVWLSIKNASFLCEYLAEIISYIDAEHSSDYYSNCKSYIETLNELDEQYFNCINNAKYDTVVFGDRFPFRYLFDDYNIKYYAAFAGCSAETEASFNTILFLAEKIDEIGLDCIMTIDGSDFSIAKTILKNTSGGIDYSILSLNSMQSITQKDIADGISYLKIAEDNLAVLEEALN